MTPQRLALLALCSSLLGLAGCDQLGIETPALEAARREAEGKAVGAGCRHAARSVENCFELNKRAEKAAVFAGWREMNDYMRENKLEPQPPAPPPPAMAAADNVVEGDEPPAATPAGSAKGRKAADDEVAVPAKRTKATAAASPKSH